MPRDQGIQVSELRARGVNCPDLVGGAELDAVEVVELLRRNELAGWSETGDYETEFSDAHVDFFDGGA